MIPSVAAEGHSRLSKHKNNLFLPLHFFFLQIPAIELPAVSFIYVIYAKETNVTFSIEALRGLFSGFLVAGVTGVLSRGCCFTVLRPDADGAGSGDSQSRLFILDSGLEVENYYTVSQQT